MTDRNAELRDLAAALREHAAVEDAWLAKSFTDRLLVIDLAGSSVPDELRDRLGAHDLRGANDVYGVDEDDPSFVGTVDGSRRHRFVDLRTRGDHQSYVVD